MSNTKSHFKNMVYKVGRFFKKAPSKTGRFFKKTPGYLQKKQLLVPIMMMVILVVINVCLSTSFFRIVIGKNTFGNVIMQGDIINILKDSSEIVILAIGMTFVTSACGGQDISVGAGMAIAGTIMMKMGTPDQFNLPIIVALLITCVISIAFAMLNGVLVSYFKILPMVATLILFTAGRDIALWIGGGTTMYTSPNTMFTYFGSVAPHFAIPLPIMLSVMCIVIISIILKFSNLRLYTQSVGINARSSKLNGISPEKIKMISFVIMGLCVAVAGFIAVSKTGTANYVLIGDGIELDVILAVAIGGTMLGGGKFNLAGSIMGGYIISLLSLTLLRMGVKSEVMKTYKAIFVIALVILGSPVIKEKLSAFWAKLTKSIKKRSNNIELGNNNNSIEEEGV